MKPKQLKAKPPNIPPIKCMCCKLIFPANANRHPIFGNHDTAPRLQQMLTTFLMKPIIAKLDTEQSICDNCLAQLEQSYAFKMRCLKLQEEEEEQNDEDNDEIIESFNESDDQGESPQNWNIEEDNCSESSSTLVNNSEECSPSHNLGEAIESLQSTADDNNRSDKIAIPKTISNSFADCLDVNVIKNCIRIGTPIHQGKRTTIIANELYSTKSRTMRGLKSVKLTKKPKDDEFVVNSLPLNPFQSAQIDIHQYLKSLVSVRFRMLDGSDVMNCCVS